MEKIKNKYFIGQKVWLEETDRKFTIITIKENFAENCVVYEITDDYDDYFEDELFATKKEALNA